MAIELDPGTICARTNAGEVELQEAQNGLTLPQRKALSLLVAPQAFAELAAENHLEPVRLGRDLARLAEIGLIVLLVPAARSGRTDQVGRSPDPRPRASAVACPPIRPLMLPLAIAAALVIAVAVAWLAARGNPAPALSPPTPRAEFAAPIPTAAADPTRDVDAVESASALPAPARMRNRTASAGRSASRN